MFGSVEIDKAGRIVVPKKLRDALHLAPGTRLRVERSGDTLMLTPSSNEAQLIIQNGVPLIFPADRGDVPTLSNSKVYDLIAQGRGQRALVSLGAEADPYEECE
jgi:AbrB family looped-hinge helix DNA binding protein